MSIVFKEITEENYVQVLAIRQTSEQEAQHFVAPVVRSLADAWLYRHDGDTFPYAIYDDQLLVGFLLLDTDFEERQYFIWRLIVDQKHQGRSYGTQIIQKIIQLAKSVEGIDKVVADYVDGNDVMKHILEKLGFYQTDYLEDRHETVMTRIL